MIDMKKIILYTVLAFIFSAGLPGFVSAVLTKADFENITFSGNRGSVNEASHGHVIYNLGKGWNLVPLKFLMESKGRYSSYQKEGKTCDSDVFDNVWYYSPAKGSYYHMPALDDWSYPKTRNNDFLLNEFKQKYYHIHAGSAWAYTPEDCSLEGEDGTQLISENYGNAEQEKNYNYKELVLKAGWNFVPVDYKMVAYEKSLVGLFSKCEPEKFYKYDKHNNKWVNLTEASKAASASSSKLFPLDIFDTILVKTKKDCNFADYSMSSISVPPSL